MKVTTEELERCEFLMTIEFEPAKEQDLLKKAAKRIAREVRIPGFRPGKAPYNVVVRRFGMEAIQQEVLEKSADGMIKKALEEANIEPYAQMELDSIDWDPLTIKVKIPTRPKIELGNYRDIRLEAKPVEVTEEEVEQALENMQEQAATWAPVERPAEISDLISMSVVEKDGDEILAQRDSAEYELTTAEDGDHSPDLTTPLLGLSAGDEKIFTLTYPEDFGNERYAGKDITFEVKVSSVKVKEVDPLDDEFAKSIGDFETLEELEEDLRENIRQQHEKQYNRELGNQALDKIIENAEAIDWPMALEEENIDQEMKRYGDQLESSGLTMEGYLRMQEKTEDEFREETRERVIDRLKRSLILGKVAKLENLEVSESEILERAKLIADLSGLGDQIWRDILASQDQQNVIANDLIIDKVVERLATIAKGEIPEEPEAESTQAENNESPESDEDEGISEPVSSSSEVTPDETEADASPTDVDKNEPRLRLRS